MFIDVHNGLIDLCLGRRIIGQMTFGHAHGTDVHGKRALNLGSGRTDAVATDDQLGGPAAEINHQIGGGRSSRLTTEVAPRKLRSASSVRE